MRKRTKNILFHIALPILIGIVIYAFRFKQLVIIDRLFDIRNVPILPTEYQYFLPTHIAYNLPDFLWCHATISTILLIWGKTWKSLAGLTFLLAAFLLAIGSEFLQYFNPKFGTFDQLDICAYILAFLTAFYSLVCTHQIKLHL